MSDAALHGGWCVLSYLIGSVSWSLILVRLVAGIDLRTQGSGNLGATNTGRVLGLKGAFAVYVLDVSKGLLASGVPLWAWGGPSLGGVPVAILAGCAAILGHIFPFYLGFKGGKGVATGSGVLFAIAPLTGLVAILVWAVCVRATRMVSLASILAASSLPLLYPWLAATNAQFPWYEGFFIAVALLVVVMHKSNIKRILEGRENKIGKRT